MLGSQDSNSWLKHMTQTPNSNQDSKSKLKTQTHDSRTNIFYHHQSNQKEVNRTSIYSIKRIDKQSNESVEWMIRFREWTKESNELNQMNRIINQIKKGMNKAWMVSHNDAVVLHAQRDSRRIESPAQVSGHGRHSGDTHNLFGLLLSLFWTTCDMCGRGHGIACPGGSLSRKGGGNSSTTGIPTTPTTCSWPLDAADYYLAYLVFVYQ